MATHNQSPFTTKKHMSLKHSTDKRSLVNSTSNTILTKEEFENFFEFDDIRIAICVTMYNEDIDLLKSTLRGIYENLQDLGRCDIERKNILLIIISDGFTQINKSVSEGLNLTDVRPQDSDNPNKMTEDDGPYVIDRVKAKGNNTEQSLYTCLIQYKKNDQFDNIINEDFKFILGIKELNKGKLDSHYWFFWGFSKLIDPDYIILIDCGTVPLTKSLFNLIQPMINDEQLGGVCGEMTLSNNDSCFNFVTNAQDFEYKFAHKVDKHLESLFGFITVLPGAFSAYRWECLKKGKIMQNYFLSLFPKDGVQITCSVANMYLAEDRIFCHYLFNMEDRSVVLKYLPEALAETDAPEDLVMFMAQRRRWINGSVFALWHVMSHASEVFQSKHSFLRKFFFLFLTFYFFIQTVLSYFVLGNFFFVYQLLCNDIFGIDENKANYVRIIMSVYLFLIFFTVVISLVLKPKDGKYHYRILSVAFALYTLFGTVFTIKSLVDNFTFISNKDNVYNLGTTYWGVLICLCIGLMNYIIPLLLNPVSMLKSYIFSFIQYCFMQSTYSILLIIYAYCNIDDVSWGNRDSAVKIDITQFKFYKLKLLIIWLMANFAYGWVFSWLVTTSYKIIFINYFGFVIAGLTLFKILGSTLDNLKYRIFDRCRLYKKTSINKRKGHFEDVEKNDVVNSEANNLDPESQQRIENSKFESSKNDNKLNGTKRDEEPKLNGSNIDHEGNQNL